MVWSLALIVSSVRFKKKEQIIIIVLTPMALPTNRLKTPIPDPLDQQTKGTLRMMKMHLIYLLLPLSSPVSQPYIVTFPMRDYQKNVKVFLTLPLQNHCNTIWAPLYLVDHSLLFLNRHPHVRLLCFTFQHRLLVALNWRRLTLSLHLPPRSLLPLCT